MTLHELLPAGVRQTELHRHLDVSIRSATLLEFLKQQGLEPESTTLHLFQPRVWLKRPMSDLPSVLNLFQTFQKVFRSPEICSRVAYEVVEDCFHEGTRRVELRYSPGFVSEFTGLDWQAALDGFHDGLVRAIRDLPDRMEAGLLCIASRDYGVEAASKTVQFFLRNQDKFVGMDLAGNELNWPTELFRDAFRPARDAGARLTIHAGEASGPDQMWEAIEGIGATRIGHGVACVRDPRLMEELARRAICLEICPTSNWLTQCVPSIEEHPLPRILRAGVPVCVNTDDPGVFDVTLPSEMELCRTRMGVTESEVKQLLAHAWNYSFLGRA